MLSWANLASDDEEDFIPPKVNPLFEAKDQIPLDLADQLQLDSLDCENLRLFDHNDNFYLIHYISDPPGSEVEKYRGMIYKKIDGEYKVVCKSFPYTHEHILGSVDIPDFTLKRVNIVKAYEGMVLRVWWDEKWYLSTHRKIDGRRSRWSGSKTFGEMFDEMWNEEWYERLDKKLCYMFLLCHPHNRLACDHSEPKLWHVGVYSPEIDQFLKLESHQIGVDNPEKVEVETFKELEKIVSKMEWKHEPGVLLTLDDEYRKILNPQYLNKRELRGNEPNLRMRWFQLREEGKEKELEELLSEKSSFFDQLKQHNLRVLDYLLDTYDFRYYQGNYLRLPKEDFIVLENFDKMWNEANLEYNENNLRKVLQTTLDKYNPRIRNALIKHMLEWENQE